MRGGSPWLYSFIREWQSWHKPPLAKAARDSFRTEVRFEGESLWIVNQWPSGARLICCAAYCPGGAEVAEKRLEQGRLEIALKTVIGVQRVKIELPEKKPLLHWQTSVSPRKRLTVPFWPCDLYPVDERGNPLETRGVVHTKQMGPRGGILYVTLTRPQGGSFLYAQNLTALNDYFKATRTTPSDRITDAWPELGFQLPPSAEGGLAEDQPVVISDAFMQLSQAVPVNELESTRSFLELYSQLYLELPRPVSAHRDWPRRVDDTIHDLENSPACTMKRGKHRYLVAYAGDQETPPESMVQLAVLLPILEYERSRKLRIPLAAELQANIPTFYNEKIQAVGRWLPGEERFLTGKEDHLKENVMDSWYLYHTGLNLARLAQFGNGQARKLFTDTLKYGIRVARHFNYRWPCCMTFTISTSYGWSVVRAKGAKEILAPSSCT